MTLYEQVKDAIERGVPPEHIAAVFGISLNLVLELKKLMEKVKEIDELMKDFKVPS